MSYSGSFYSKAPAALTGGAIAGIVIGVIFFIAVLFVLRRIALQRRSPYSSSAGQATTVVVVSGNLLLTEAQSV